MNKKTDVAVVGGGIGGLHVAWRLTDPLYRIAGTKRSVILFEATNRLGGRLKSIEVKGVNFPLELGAMRFKESHYLLDGLIKHLGEEIGDMGIKGGSYYLRGRRKKTLRQLASTAYLLLAMRENSLPVRTNLYCWLYIEHYDHWNSRGLKKQRKKR